MSRVERVADIVVFVRGELRKQPHGYILALATLLKNDRFREYRIVPGVELRKGVQGLLDLSRNIPGELERGERVGFGVLVAATELMTACVILTGRPDEDEGVPQLLQRDRTLVYSRIPEDWRLLQTDVADAFRAVMKQQCGYVAGEAGVLRKLMFALQRDRKPHEFAPVWFANEEARKIGERIRNERHRQEEEADRRRKQRDEERIRHEKERATIEARLRKLNGVRARALRDSTRQLIKDAAENGSSDLRDLFPQYVSWVSRRSKEQWETTEVVSDIEDFGTVVWNGRPLDGILLRTEIRQLNRIRGERSSTSFLIGLVQDVEFSMSRDPMFAGCTEPNLAVMNWKGRRQFSSQWNAE